MDVEYIPLETNDEFLTQGFVQDVGKDMIVVRNYANDGDIFIFDRKGKAIKKINRKGQGGEEYVYPLSTTLDEDKGELFVNSHSSRRILVYDPEGNFKRSLKLKQNTLYRGIYNFGRDHLICYDGATSDDGESNEQPFMLISKQDGSITRGIEIPFEEKIITAVIKKDEANNMTWGASPSTHYAIIPHLDGWIVVEPSADTLYRYAPDHTMAPFIVRTPSVQSTDPKVFLFPSILTDRYYFMEAVKREFDFEKDEGFPGTNLVYDKQEKSIYRYTVYNGDYSSPKEIFMNLRSINTEIASWQRLDAPNLVEAYKKGELKGRLKEIAAGLNEEDNAVIMLIKYKKL
jgi:hypothetical protein